MTGLYFDFHFPLSLKHLIESLFGNKNYSPNNPPIAVDTSTREWFSQPRPSTDPTVEVVSVNFKLPLSVSEISTELVRTPCKLEIWYRDRSNNWRQVLDRQRIPLSLELSESDYQSWYKYRSTVYPIVAKSLQFRITRVPTLSLETKPYSVGLRNSLIKRNVYDRTQGTQYFEDEQDVLGNVVSKYIKDWDATKAADGTADTYWKSAPQPDPSAVVSLYMDIRGNDDTPQLVDRVFIDPVHQGQQMNIYYSSDDVNVTQKISPISQLPFEDTNTDWKVLRGRQDIQAAGSSRYALQTAWGPLNRKATWFGLEWAPDFAPSDGPSLNPLLLNVFPQNWVTGLFSPQFRYDVGSGIFELEFTDGTTSHLYSAPIISAFEKNEPLRIVFGWDYESDGVAIIVKGRNGRNVAFSSSSTTSLPQMISLDGTLEIKRFRGLLTAYIIKLESFNVSASSFLNNASAYTNPEPVLPDDLGNVPSTTLDNAIYSVDWTQQEHGIGGQDQSNFSEKVWIPIWRNYVVERGMLFLPQTISCKYLKFEFTQLTEEPYPVYESGIEVSYKVFPITVQQVATQGPRIYTEPGGFLGLGNVLSVNGVKSVNFFNPLSVLNAAQSILGKTYEPVRIDAGPGYVTNSLPHTLDSPIDDHYRLELSSNAIYRREVLNSYTLASDQYNTIIKAEGLAKLSDYTSVPWEDIYNSNVNAISKVPQLGALPVRGTDWWIFPGQELKIPASVMNKLTSGATVTERRATLEHRVRFTTSSVHRYEMRTVKRDSAIAYFAGVREIIPFASSYLTQQDVDSYNFSLYSGSQWVFNGIRQIPSGPVSTQPSLLDRISDDLEDEMGDTNIVTAATMYKNFTTQSSFARVKATFRDSGLIRSDALWASSTSDQLAPGASTIPETIPGTTWLDTFAAWNDTVATWGSARGIVAVSLDEDRRYQGKRVLKFTRASGGGEAGIKMRQRTNYERGALFRLGVVLYKPYANNNITLLRLVRRSDQVIIYETPVQVTPGRWTEFTTELKDVPATGALDYEVQLVLTGDQEEEMYVSDLYSELAHIRYFIRLGGGSEFLHEVTDLRYKDSAYVVSGRPVTEMSVQVTIVSPKAWAYGLDLAPTYLK